MGELYVAQHFLSLGYEVFTNVSHTGPADMTVWMPGEEPKLVDVKTQSNPYVRKDGTYCYGFQCEQRADGVYQVIYNVPAGLVLIPDGFTRTREQD